MLFEGRCSKGKLQVLEDGIVRVQAFGKAVWQISQTDIKRLATQPGMMTSLNITIYTSQSAQYADTVSKQDFAKFQALFPDIQVEVITGREWYHDIRTLTHIETYDNQRKMQKDLEGAAQNGWTIQGQSSIGSHINVGRSVTKFVLTGGVGMMTGASRSKEKTTLTFVRTPEWLEMHR